MNFNLEKDMIPSIENFVFKNFDCKLIARELPVNHRIIDISFANIDSIDQKLFENFKVAFNKMTMNELDVLANIYIKKKVSIHYLIKKLRIDSDTIKKTYLKKFIENRLLIQVSRYQYQTTEWADIKIKNVFAVEAKISDWKNALSQAIDNFCFADYSYVALDEMACSQNIIKKFNENNVGLILVNNKDVVKLVNKPTKNKNKNKGDEALQKLIIYRDIICNKGKWSLI